MVSRRVVIRGRVQGVGFRAWTVGQAASLDIYGWVRNRVDGSVEALLHGPSEAVKMMIAACHNGPAWARVISVEAEESDEVADRFEQRATG